MAGTNESFSEYYKLQRILQASTHTKSLNAYYKLQASTHTANYVSSFPSASAEALKPSSDILQPSDRDERTIDSATGSLSREDGEVRGRLGDCK